jgi:hypothetical protein
LIEAVAMSFQWEWAVLDLIGGFDIQILGQDFLITMLREHLAHTIGLVS